jgi:hypothetical protein
MTRPTFCRRIVRPFVNPDAADGLWCLGVQDAWEHGCLPPSPRHQGHRVRASMLQDALDVQRDEPMRRPRLETRVQCPDARPCGPLRLQPARRGGALCSRRQPAVACLGMRDNAVRSPPACDNQSSQGERLRTPCGFTLPYPAQRVQAALCRAAAGGVPKVVRDPYARYRRPAQPLRWLPRVTRAGGGALVSGRVAPSTVAVRQWCLTHKWLRVFRSAGGTTTAPGSTLPPPTRRRGTPATREGEPQYTPGIEQKA